VGLRVVHNQHLIKNNPPLMLYPTNYLLPQWLVEKASRLLSADKRSVIYCSGSCVCLSASAPITCESRLGFPCDLGLGFACGATSAYVVALVGDEYPPIGAVESISESKLS
jgi:hypothetical protein